MKYDFNNIPEKIKPACIHIPEVLPEDRAKNVDVNLNDKRLFEKFERLGWEMVSQCVANSSTGLAAPQVGVNQNMFIAIDFKRSDIWQFDNTYSMFINPVITQAEKHPESYSFPENCLSCVNRMEFFPVVRPRKILVSYWYFNEKQQLKQSTNEEFEGYPARIIQHEFDHLCNKCIFDKVQEPTKPRRGRPPKSSREG